MLDGIKFNKKSHFWHENVEILRSLTQRFIVHHNVSLLLCVQEFSEQRFFAFISLCAD